MRDMRKAEMLASSATGQPINPEEILTNLMLELHHTLDMGGKLTLPIQIQMKKADEYLNGLVPAAVPAPESPLPLCNDPDCGDCYDKRDALEYARKKSSGVALEEVAREIIDVMVKSDFVVEVCGEKGMPISEIVAILSRSGAGEPKGAEQQ